MKDPPLVDQFTLCTVPVVAQLAGGKTRRGTGFYYDAGKVQGWPLSLIITNKHVIAESTAVTVFSAFADSAGLPRVGSAEGITLGDPMFSELVVNHPDDDVDLCAIIAWPIIHHAKGQAEKIVHRHVNAGHLVTDAEIAELSAVEDILLIGYPAGLWDRVNLRPLARRGITSTHAALNYNGRAEFLIDASCFSGSSGSPVVLYRPELRLDNGEFSIDARPRLLGVLAEAPRHSEIALVDNAFALSEERASVEYDVPLNLGTVLQARRVRELEIPALARAQQVKPKMQPKE